MPGGPVRWGACEEATVTANATQSELYSRRMSTALRTDQYELTMLEAAIASGAAERPAVFEVFARRLPRGRRFGVLAGVGRLVEAVAEFRFGDAELAFLEQRGFLSARTLDWLASYAFDGDIAGFAEGEVWFPYDP